MSLILLNSDFEVEKTQTYSWNILADVEKVLSYSWHIHEYVEKALSYSWTFTVWVEKALSYSWEIKKWVERVLLYSWITTLIVGAVQYEFSSLKRYNAFYMAILNKVIGLKAAIVCCIADPSMAYDYDSSGETVARDNSVTVAITGNNCPFTWAVSGTGFTLDNATTEGLTNTLNADGTACGSATITVTGCDGTVGTGYVRCTFGQWSNPIIGVKLTGDYDTVELDFWGSLCMNKTHGMYKQYQSVGHSGHGWTPCAAIDCADYYTVNCLAGHEQTECFNWTCETWQLLASDMNPVTTCTRWCCAPGGWGYVCNANYYCVCNFKLLYKEWTC